MFYLDQYLKKKKLIQSCSVTHSEVLEFTALERTYFQYFWEFKISCGCSEIMAALVYGYIYSWEMVVPWCVILFVQGQRVWCLSPLLQDIYWSWRNDSGSCGECPFPLVKADVQQSPGAWEILWTFVCVVLTNTSLTLPEVRLWDQTMQCMTFGHSWTTAVKCKWRGIKIRRGIK